MKLTLALAFSLLGFNAFAADTAAPTTTQAAQPSAPADTVAAPAAGAVKHAKVWFIEPKDGATVPQEFTAKFGIEGMKVQPAGGVVMGEGHHHVIVDGGPVKKGEIVGNDATHLHFGKAQTEAHMKLAPGKHTLTLQFADGAHRSYGEAMSQTIHITVK